MRFLAALFVLFLALRSPHTAAAEDTGADTNEIFSMTVTDADRQFLGQILHALEKKDMDWIAGRMIYPIWIYTDGKTQDVTEAEEFAKIARQRLTNGVCARIAEAAKKPLFKNWQGVMIGNGILWFSEYADNVNGPWKYGISAIGDFAFQPDYEGRAESHLSWEKQCNLRAITALHIEQAIYKRFRPAIDSEDAYLRMYQQNDIDGDGVDDTVLIATFEDVQGNTSFQELFVCLSLSPGKVMQSEVGSKWDRTAEKLTVKNHKIIIDGEKWAKMDAGCCPSQPYESVFVVSGGKIVEQQ